MKWFILFFGQVMPLLLIIGFSISGNMTREFPSLVLWKAASSLINYVTTLSVSLVRETENNDKKFVITVMVNIPKNPLLNIAVCGSH